MPSRMAGSVHFVEFKMRC